MVISTETQELVSTERLNRITAEASRRGASAPPHEKTTNDSHLSSDTVELSERVFDTLSRGIESLKKADLNLASQRLAAAQELLETTRLLLSEASAEQKGVILSNINAIGQELGGIGSQIEQIFGGADSPPAVAYRESLSAEYSITSLSLTEESITVAQTDDGFEIQRAIEQTQIIVAQLEIESTQTLAVSDSIAVPQLLNVGEQFEDLLASFRHTIRDFQSVLHDLLESFTQEEVQPEVPIDLLEAFLGGILDISSKST